MFLESILKEVPGQSQRHALCELPASSALRPVSGNGLSCNLRAAGFLWALLLVWHQKIGMPMRYSHWKFNHMWTSEFRYWRSYPHLILYSKKVFILCGEKVKGQNSNTSEKHPKGQQERKTQHHLKVKKWGFTQQCHLGRVSPLLDYIRSILSSSVEESSYKFVESETRSQIL